MDGLLNSFLLVFASEMGDKTQLLALVLAARFRQPWVILGGVFVATLLNHALAAYFGTWVAAQVSHETLKALLAISFIGFGFWLLLPDKEEEFKHSGRFGAFLTTVIAFFIAEMGDKTQLATVALGARYGGTMIVTFGTTAGMLASNALAIFLGKKLLQRVPMQSIRIFACVLFVIFGLAVFFGF